MRRVYKILGILAIVAVLILGSVVLAVRFLPDTEIVRSSVQEKLREVTGQDVAIGALHVSTSFPRLVHLRLEDISVNSPQGKQLMSADSIVLSPSLFALFHREIAVESATITGLRVALERSENAPLALPADKKAAAPQSLPEAPAAVEPARVQEAGAPPSPEQKPETRPGPAFRWSLKSIHLVDARIDWTDRRNAPDKDVMVSLNGLDGSLVLNADQAYRTDFSGLLAVDKVSAGPVKLKGTIAWSEESSQLVSADLEMRTPSLALKPLYELLPAAAAPVREFAAASTTCGLQWERSHEPKIVFRTELKTDEQQPSQVSLQGEARTTPDFSRLLEAKGTVETHSLPLRLMKSAVPENWPVDAEVGVVKGTIEGSWSGGDNWRVNGSAGIENGLLKGALKGIAQPIRVWAQFKLDPEALSLESLDISGPSKIAFAAGKVTKPLASNYGLDLHGDIYFDAYWLKAFGVRLPPALAVHGVVPINAVLRGDRGEIWIDASGDLAGTEILWSPYMRKASGQKGNLAFKGKILSAAGPKDRGQRVASLVRLSLAGTAIRLDTHAPWLTGSNVQLTSRLLANGGRWDLKDANLSVRRGTEASDLVNAKGTIVGLDTGSPKVDVAGTIGLDKGLLSLVGVDLPQGYSLGGNAPVKVQLGGTTNDLDWSAEVPLTHLDINLKQAFRKPGGVNGSLSASGKLTGAKVTLNNGRLALPGLLVHAQGTVVDEKGKFGNLTCSVRKADLKEAAKLVPPASGMGLGGQVEASILLKPVNDTVTPTGSIRLLSAEYRPEKAAWGLDKIKGNLALDGTSLAIPEVSGNIVGTLEGPFKVKGNLTNLGSVDQLNGGISVEVGQGRIRADKLRNLLSQTQILIGTLLNPQTPKRRGDFLEVQSVTGDFQIRAGTVRTENLSVRGPELNSGAMGTLRLPSNDLDLLVGVHTVTAVGETIGKIPGVKEFIKKHEGLLTATGLDKELKRFGLDTKDATDDKADNSKPAKTPVTVLFRIQGSARSPQVTPVLEQSLNKATLARLKSLMQQ